jgi:hypothetical protein
MWFHLLCILVLDNDANSAFFLHFKESKCKSLLGVDLLPVKTIVYIFLLSPSLYFLDSFVTQHQIRPQGKNVYKVEASYNQNNWAT